MKSSEDTENLHLVASELEHAFLTHTTLHLKSVCRNGTEEQRSQR
ncbi:MAG: hypothetical protein RIS79_236 [Verrucomicrobiota bacterium]|jgi:hypothetical protein